MKQPERGIKIHRINFVTRNKSKLKEAKEILNNVEIENIELDIPELQGTPEDIVKEKAKAAAELTKKAVFVEDVSDCFHALGGMPGPYVKDFLKAMRLEDIPKLLDSFEDKSATAICSIGYCEPNKEPICIQGKVKGIIVPPRGKNHFGWDPIFQPDGHDKTFAEMTAEEKNKISHRRLALEKFKEYLEKNEI
ncbi:RdgB/HAM1 family non-canonical purine NTP pyrophosphatase [Candidatus Woesearchaeota archaeon]|nr:RdgB/HAM1 family non-canonical purine NTP pyrophosphatase [Candidatus Woesearchaeota archaeon]